MGGEKRKSRASIFHQREEEAASSAAERDNDTNSSPRERRKAFPAEVSGPVMRSNGEKKGKRSEHGSPRGRGVTKSKLMKRCPIEDDGV